MQKPHSAISFERHGRGQGVMLVPVVTLVTVGKQKTGGEWHVADPNTPICGQRGAVQLTEKAQDPKTVRLLGKTVCGRCVKQLGPIPPARYVKDLDQ